MPRQQYKMWPHRFHPILSHEEMSNIAGSHSIQFIIQRARSRERLHVEPKISRP